MKVTFAHLCDYASISKDGKLSLNGLFRAIFTPAVPVMHPMLFFAFELECSPAEFGREFKIDISLVTQDGKGILGVSATPKFDVVRSPGGPIFIPQCLGFAAVQFPEFGDYSFNIFINGDLKHSAPFAVIKPPDQPPNGPGPAQGLPK